MISEVRVLHVDDEPVICDLTKLLLEKDGKIKVDAVTSAHVALDLIKSGSYSCIISDYEMPQMNGLDFLKAVRDIDKDIPFILFSGRGRETVIIDAINSGADFYIQKGGETKALFVELNHKVNYAIQQRNTRNALKRRDGILEAVSLVSNLFLGGEAFDRALQEAITLFGLATEVDAVRLFRLKTEEVQGTCLSYFSYEASWTRASVQNPVTEEYLRKHKFFEVDEIIERLTRGETLIYDSSQIQKMSINWTEYTAKAIAIFPVFVNQQVWGLFSFADYLGDRNWTGVEIDALQAAAAMIGSAIQQDRMKKSLLSAKEEYASMYALMRRLCDTVPDVLWAKDNEGSFIFVNKAGSDFLDARDTTEPVGKKEEDFPCGVIYHPREDNDADASFCDLKERISVRTRTGLTEFDIITVPFVNNEGSQIGSVTLGRDITSYCQIEKALRRSQHRYENIIEAINIGVILVDKEGIIREINPCAQELLDIPKEDILNKHLNVHPVLCKLEMCDMIREVVNTGRGISRIISNEGVSSSGELYCMVRLLVPENGGPAEVLITLDPHLSW
ncbi:MAG: response regulator [Methanomicrobiales archaeon]|nr:response regulator [Methanomicrobiales archaeon]